MSKTVVFGPGLTPGRHTRAAEKAVQDLQRRGLDVIPIERVKGEHATGYLKRVYGALMEAEALVLLPDWDENTDSLVIGQVAFRLRLPVQAWIDAESPLKDLTEDKVVAPLLPGQGVVAPDSDPGELPHEEAARMVLGPRGAFYDTPYKNLGRTGIIWTGILYSKLKPGEVITAEEVAMCMVGVKLAREAFRHKRDNITDAHGYLMTIDMIRDEIAAEEAAAEAGE